MKVCSVFLSVSPRGDSNEYIQHTIIYITLNFAKYNNVCSYRIFSYCTHFSDVYRSVNYIESRANRVDPEVAHVRGSCKLC